MEEICLGSRTLQPGRQLLAGDERIPVGKRALDIISVLGDAGGKIVTKDELLAAVWPGITVEENALQVHIVALRKALGPEAVRLKTIRGVGYQLDVDCASPGREGSELKSPPLPVPASPARDLSAETISPKTNVAARTRGQSTRPSGALTGRRVIALVLIGLVGLAAAAAFLVPRTPPTGTQEIVLVDSLTATGGADAEAFAMALRGDIVDVFNQSRIQIAGDQRGGLLSQTPQANRILDGTVSKAGDRLKVQLLLEDRRSGTLLWSKQFERDVGAEDLLSMEASAAAARTIHTIRELAQQNDLRLDPKTLALHIRGNELLRSAQLFAEDSPRDIFKEIIDREPNSAHARGLYALTLAGAAFAAPAEERPALLARAREEIARAIEIDPAAAGPAFDALYGITVQEHPKQYVIIEDELLESLHQAPDFAFLVMRECRLLTDMGRALEALTYCRRAVALHPFAEPIAHSYVHALNAAGEEAQAQEAIDRALRFGPDNVLIRLTRFELAAFGGRPDVAREQLIDPAASLPFESAAKAVIGRYLANHGRWSPAERERMSGEIVGLVRSGKMAMDIGVMMLCSLDQVDQAFTLLRLPDNDRVLFSRGAGLLFQPVTAPLRRDPRFWAIAAYNGLARYWLQRDRWPDFCGREVPLGYCKRQAAQALAAA